MDPNKGVIYEKQPNGLVGKRKEDPSVLYKRMMGTPALASPFKGTPFKSTPLHTPRTMKRISSFASAIVGSFSLNDIPKDSQTPYDSFSKRIE